MRDATLVIRMENHPGVLARIAAMLHRRGINVARLTVAPTAADDRVSELTMRTAGAPVDLERVALAIANLVDVYDVRLDVEPTTRSGAPLP